MKWFTLASGADDRLGFSANANCFGLAFSVNADCFGLAFSANANCFGLGFSAFSANGKDVIVDFPQQSHWTGLLSEMELVPSVHPGVRSVPEPSHRLTSLLKRNCHAPSERAASAVYYCKIPVCNINNKKNESCKSKKIDVIGPGFVFSIGPVPLVQFYLEN